jgi:hypothetical protein
MLAWHLALDNLYLSATKIKKKPYNLFHNGGGGNPMGEGGCNPCLTLLSKITWYGAITEILNK